MTSVKDGRDGTAEKTIDGAGEKTKPRTPARSYTPSEKAQALERAAVVGVSEASRTLGMSRFSIYAWQRQAKKAAAGEGPSPTRGPAPAEIEAQRDREILAEWKQHPGLGPSQVRNQLRRPGIKVAVATTRRVMEDAGYRPPKVTRERYDKRYEPVRPNHLWHLDRLGLPCPNVEHILEATGVKRGRAYELRDRIQGLLQGLVRRPGRPRVSPTTPPSADPTAELTRETLRFLMDHPGCVYGGKKQRRYADTFRHWVLERRQQYPHLDLPLFADAVGVPAGTAEDWLRVERVEPSGEPGAPTSSHDAEPDAKITMIETVLHAWREWRGSFSSFCAHFRQHHRLDLCNTLISQILFDCGERSPARRGRRSSDENATDEILWSAPLRTTRAEFGIAQVGS